MFQNKKLNYNLVLVSRVCNNTGDWFYYFIINIVIYNLNNSAFIMSILTLCYIFPGAVLTSLINRCLNKVNLKKALIISDLIRAICILIMIVTDNLWIILMMVFLEQIFSIASSLSFGTIIPSTFKDKYLLKFNKWYNLFSNITRLMVIPVFIFLGEIVGTNGILFFNFILTIISVILISFSNIQINEINDNNIDYSIENNDNKQLFNIVIIFSLLSIIRVCLDSYGILCLAKISNEVATEYSYFSMLITLAMILSSYFSEYFSIKFNENIEKITKLIIGSISISIIIITTIGKLPLFLVGVFLISFLINSYELLMLYKIQIYGGNDIQSLLAFQTKLYNIVSVTNVFVGSMLITKISIESYFYLISITIFLGGTYYSKKCLYN